MDKGLLTALNSITKLRRLLFVIAFCFYMPTVYASENKCMKVFSESKDVKTIDQLGTVELSHLAFQTPIKELVADFLTQNPRFLKKQFALKLMLLTGLELKDFKNSDVIYSSIEEASMLPGVGKNIFLYSREFQREFDLYMQTQKAHNLLYYSKSGPKQFTKNSKVYVSWQLQKYQGNIFAWVRETIGLRPLRLKTNRFELNAYKAHMKKAEKRLEKQKPKSLAFDNLSVLVLSWNTPKYSYYHITEAKLQSFYDFLISSGSSTALALQEIASFLVELKQYFENRTDNIKSYLDFYNFESTAELPNFRKASKLPVESQPSNSLFLQSQKGDKPPRDYLFFQNAKGEVFGHRNSAKILLEALAWVIAKAEESRVPDETMQLFENLFKTWQAKLEIMPEALEGKDIYKYFIDNRANNQVLHFSIGEARFHEIAVPFFQSSRDSWFFGKRKFSRNLETAKDIKEVNSLMTMLGKQVEGFGLSNYNIFGGLKNQDIRSFELLLSNPQRFFEKKIASLTENRDLSGRLTALRETIEMFVLFSYLVETNNFLVNAPSKSMMKDFFKYKLVLVDFESLYSSFISSKEKSQVSSSLEPMERQYTEAIKVLHDRYLSWAK